MITRIFYNEIFEHESHELHEYFIAHGSHTRILFAALRSLVFEHEIRRRPTDRREVIKRIARIVFARGSYSVFNTHTDFTLFFICTRISRITRIFVRGGALTGGLNTIFLNTNFSLNEYHLHTDVALFYTHTDRAHLHNLLG